MISRCLVAVLAVVLAVGLAFSQTSENYRLEEHAFNAGGHPHDAEILTSGSYGVTLDALGSGVAGRNLSSASFHMDGGFVSAYPPPGEVLGLSFVDDVSLIWDSDPSVGVYNLYRDSLSALSGMGYGQCEQSALEDETATDNDTPPSSAGYFYLVTAENRLHEEGTKGWDSSGAERPNPSPCP